MEPARRLPLREVATAKRIEGGFLSPSGIPFLRVDVWGIVVRKYVGRNHVYLIIDDLTDTMPVYVFGEVSAEKGDRIRVIGRLREREGKRSIVAEIVKPLNGYGELIHRLQNVLTLLRASLVKEEDVDVVNL